MTLLDLNEAADLWIGRQRDYVAFSTEQYNSGVKELYGADRPLSPTWMRQIANVLERNAHGAEGARKGRGVRCRVVYAVTLRGLHPIENWLRIGGTRGNHKRGFYIKLPEGSREDVFYWKDFDDSGPSDPDGWGRPESGMSDDAIDARLRAAMDRYGELTGAIAAGEFGLQGNRKRDRRNSGRVYLRQSKRFQSLGDGKYHDTEDSMSDAIREGLAAIHERRARDAVAGSNGRLSRLKTPMMLALVWVPWSSDPIPDDPDWDFL